MVRIDEYWQHNFDIKNAAGNGKFRHIQNLIKICLSIHHGNTVAERSLSGNKNVLTKERTSLSEEKLIGLRRCKQYLRNAGGAHQVLVSGHIINKVKDAHLNHTIRNMQEKEEEERQKKQSKQVQEDQYLEKKELGEKMTIPGVPKKTLHVKSIF